MNIKEISRKIYEEGWNQQNFDNIIDFISDEMILITRGKKRVVGSSDLPTIVQRWKETFPDLKFELLHLVEDDNIVAVNSILHGTPIKPWRGYQVTGQSIKIPHCFFMEFDKAILVKVWEINDFTVLDEQLS